MPPWRILSPAAALLLAALGGCSQLPAGLAAAVEPASDAEPAETPVAVRPTEPARPANPDRTPASPGVYGPPADIRQAVIAASAPRAPRRPLHETRELIGLDRSDLQSRLGTPTVKRSDAPAEIWQYRTPVCVLDLVLYRDGASFRVAHAEMRPRNGRQVATSACLASL